MRYNKLHIVDKIPEFRGLDNSTIITKILAQIEELKFRIAHLYENWL